MPSTCVRSRTRNGTCSRARPSSRPSCAPTRTTWGSTRACSSRSTSSASSAPRRWSSRRSRRARPAGARNERRRRSILGPGLVVLVGIVALLAALYALGTWGGDDNGGRAENTIDRPTATPTPRPRAQEEAQARGADACHPADRAHRDRQCLPRRRERQGADQQRDPAGGPADPALPRPPLPRHLRQRPGEDARRRPHDRRPGPLDAGRLRGAPRQAPARAVRGAAPDLLSERRASSSPAPRCCRGSSPTATARGCPSACASAASRSRRS